MGIFPRILCGFQLVPSLDQETFSISLENYQRHKKLEENVALLADQIEEL